MMWNAVFGALIAVCIAGHYCIHAIDESKFTAVFDGALPEFIYKKLIEEAHNVDNWTKSKQTLMHDKKNTFWLPICDALVEPRNYIELAVAYLASYIDKNVMVDGKKKLIGAEWWFQVRGNKEDISFHYDKDEGMASLQGKMKFPSMNTVTYLTGLGGPTVIFDMTTPDGNMDVPEIPVDGFLLYPKPNRHIIFRGNLQHGVLGSASVATFQQKSERITFLVNWWYDVPLEPNCLFPSDSMLEEIGIYKKQEMEDFVDTISFQKQIMHLKEKKVFGKCDNLHIDTSIEHDHDLMSHWTAPQSHPFHLLEIPNDSKQLTRHEIRFPPGDMHFIDLPRDMLAIHDQGQNALKVHWGPNQVYGAVGKLNLFQQNQVSQLFRLPEPKAMFIYDPKDTEFYRTVLDIALPLAKKYLGRIKVYFCATDVCADVANAFNLPLSGLPYHVIDDTKNGKKYVQPKAQFKRTPASIEKFWLEVIGTDQDYENDEL